MLYAGLTHGCSTAVKIDGRVLNSMNPSIDIRVGESWSGQTFAGARG